MTGEKTRRFAAALFLSAAMGLLVFFAMESAIARRVGADLFVPVQDGLFLPGRLARLGAALVVCLAVGLTQWGDALRGRLRTVLAKNWGCWLVSALVTALFSLWMLRVIVLSYMISDDVVALQTISQIPTQGLLPATHTFSHILFCAMLGALYGLAPDVSWYFLYYMTVQLAAMWIIGRCILTKTRHRPWPVLTGCVIHVLLGAGVFMYAFAAITFTIASALVGAAAVALMLTRDEAGSAAERVFCDILSALLMLLCWLQREQAGQAIACFWALAALYQFLKPLARRDSRWKRRAGVLAVTVAVTLAMILGVTSYRPVQAEDGYWFAENARSTVLDSLLDELQDEDFAAAGIPPELAALLRGWFFMDKRVNTANLYAVADAYHARIAGESTGDTTSIPPSETAISAPQAASAPPAEAAAVTASAETTAGTAVTAAPAPVDEAAAAGILGEFWDTVRNDRQMFCYGLMALMLFFICVAAYLGVGRQGWAEMLTAVCAIGGAGLLSLYLSVGGHFPARAFCVVIFPAIVMLLLLALSYPDRVGKKPWGMDWALGTLCAWALMVLCAVGVDIVPHATDAATREDLFSTQWKIEAYASENPDLTIINNAYNYVYDPLHASHYPENLTWWGACGVTAKAEDRIYAKTFFQEDVRFMGDNYSSLLFLLQYLTLDYGPIQAEMVTQLSPTIFVVDISRVLPSRRFTGWYEQNGMTYYFENGKALTGEQVIDGETYVFAPNGRNAEITAVPGPNGLIYSTDAYSLITGG